MPGVHQPASRHRPPLRRRAAAAAALVVCALAAPGCGEDVRHAERSGPIRPRTLPNNFNIQLFACDDWNRADQGVRDYVLELLTEISGDQVTGPGVRGRGSVLTDDQATRLFDSRCADPRARGFVLYKIYAFARGFRGGQPGT